MSNYQLILPAALLILTLATGLWLSKSGKPYSTGIMTVHKLIALATCVFAGITLVTLIKTGDPQTLIIGLIILAGLSAVALFATGAMMSIEKTLRPAWRMIHRVAPFLLTGSAAASIWLLMTP